MRIVSHEVGEALSAQTGKQLEARFLGSALPETQVVCHEQLEIDAVDRLPGVRLRVLSAAQQQPHVGRQIAAPLSEPGVDAIGIGVEKTGSFGSGSLYLRSSDPGQPEAAVVTIGAHGPLPENLGEPAGGLSPAELELQESIVGVDVAHATRQIGEARAVEVRHAPVVESNADRRRQAGDGGRASASR